MQPRLGGVATLPDGRQAQAVFALLAERYRDHQYAPDAVSDRCGGPSGDHPPDRGRSLRGWVDEFVAVTAEHTLVHFTQWASIWRGWLATEAGDGREGVALLQEALSAVRATGTQYWSPFCMALLADAHTRTGDAKRALEVLGDALEQVERTDQRVYEAELHRLKSAVILSCVPSPTGGKGFEQLVAFSSCTSPPAMLGTCCTASPPMGRTARECSVMSGSGRKGRWTQQRPGLVGKGVDIIGFCLVAGARNTLYLLTSAAAPPGVPGSPPRARCGRDVRAGTRADVRGSGGTRTRGPDRADGVRCGSGR